jgi:hypothetical protein
VLIITRANGEPGQYSPLEENTYSNATFASATVGSIVGTENGWALIQTDATGAFACTVANVSDETAYFSAITADGVSDLATRCVVVGSNVDAATWSA